MTYTNHRTLPTSMRLYTKKGEWTSQDFVKSGCFLSAAPPPFLQSQLGAPSCLQAPPPRHRSSWLSQLKLLRGAETPRDVPPQENDLWLHGHLTIGMNTKNIWGNM